MTNEELAVKIQQGETELIGVLWDQVHKFVRMMAKRRADSLKGVAVVDQEDFYQSGYFALLYAVKSFDPASGYSFLTYLGRPLKSSFAETSGYRTARQQNDPIWHCVSFDTPLDDEGTTFWDFVQDPTSEMPFLEIEREELCRAVSKALSQLTDEQKAAIRTRYYLCRPLSAEERKHEQEALRVLRKKRTLRDLRAYC